MSLPKPTIFVIDDDPGMLRSIERLLNAYRHHVQVFNSAEAFLDYANPDEAGCLLLDINLGGMSGIELSHRLTLSGNSVPIIFMTAQDSDVIRRAARETGCSAYLSKPFPAKQLIDAIDKAIAGWPRPGLRLRDVENKRGNPA